MREKKKAAQDSKWLRCLWLLLKNGFLPLVLSKNTEKLFIILVHNGDCTC